MLGALGRDGTLRICASRHVIVASDERVDVPSFRVICTVNANALFTSNSSSSCSDFVLVYRRSNCLLFRTITDIAERSTRTVPLQRLRVAELFPLARTAPFLVLYSFVCLK